MYIDKDNAFFASGLSLEWYDAIEGGMRRAPYMGRKAVGRTIYLVTQSDLTGCGIACVAMVLGMSYRGAKRLIFGNVDWRPHFGTTTKNLANALRQRGLAVRDRLTACRGNWPDLPNLCIVKVRPPGCRRKEWHWVLYGR